MEKDHLTVGVRRERLHSQFSGKLEHSGLRWAGELAAALHDRAAGQRLVQRPPADAVSRFQHYDRVDAGADKFSCRDESGDASTNDGDAVFLRVHDARIIAAFAFAATRVGSKETCLEWLGRPQSKVTLFKEANLGS
jgi:hypothetical protein